MRQIQIYFKKSKKNRVPPVVLKARIEKEYGRSVTDWNMVHVIIILERYSVPPTPVPFAEPSRSELLD